MKFPLAGFLLNGIVSYYPDMNHDVTKSEVFTCDFIRSSPELFEIAEVRYIFGERPFETVVANRETFQSSNFINFIGNVAIRETVA